MHQQTTHLHHATYIEVNRYPICEFCQFEANHRGITIPIPHATYKFLGRSGVWRNGCTTPFNLHHQGKGYRIVTPELQLA